MARSYALQALARHLGKKRSDYLVLSGARVTGSRGDAKSFALTLQIPKDRVKIVDSPPKVAREDGEILLTDTSLFQRKAEYERTILQLEKTLGGELKELKEMPDAIRIDTLARKIATCFDRLNKEVRSDSELSTIGSDLDPDEKSERDQVLAQLAQSRQRLQKRLDEVKDHPRRDKP
jgi:hypothetical protein